MKFTPPSDEDSDRLFVRDTMQQLEAEFLFRCLEKLPGYVADGLAHVKKYANYPDDAAAKYLEGVADLMNRMREQAAAWIKGFPGEFK